VQSAGVQSSKCRSSKCGGAGVLSFLVSCGG